MKTNYFIVLQNSGTCKIPHLLVTLLHKKKLVKEKIKVSVTYIVSNSNKK